MNIISQHVIVNLLEKANKTQPLISHTEFELNMSEATKNNMHDQF